jgi:exosome complex component CSL4
MSSTKTIKIGDIVLPGDRLGVIEEFIPGSGTFEDEGIIFATIYGKIEIDMKNREITVIADNQPPTGLVNGEIIVARVTSVKAKMATVEIFHSQRKDFPIPFAGMIQIRNIRKGYVDYIDEQLVQDDWIRAKVIDASSVPIQIATDEPELGVIRAFCRYCGAQISLKGNKLVCSNSECHRLSKRKLSNDYLDPKTIEQILAAEKKVSSTQKK